VPGELRSQEKKVGKDVGEAMITAAVADAAVLTELLRCVAMGCGRNREVKDRRARRARFSRSKSRCDCKPRVSRPNPNPT